MPAVFPAGAKAAGRTAYLAVPVGGLANEIAATTTELSAGTVLNITGYFYTGGEPRVAGVTDTGTAPSRVGTTKSTQQRGRTTFTSPTLSYATDPQQAGTAVINKLATMFAEGTQALVLRFDNVNPETWTPAAADKYTVALLEFGYQNVQPTGDDDYAEFSTSQAAIVIEGYPKAGAVVAGS